MTGLPPLCYLNSNDGTSLLGFGTGPSFVLNHLEDLPKLDRFLEQHRGSYLFGYLSYSLKNHVDQLPLSPSLRLPLAYFWVPDTTALMNGEHLTFSSGKPSVPLEQFLSKLKTSKRINLPPLKARTNKARYLDHVRKIQERIQLGALYETNYCQEFYLENVILSSPEDLFFHVNESTKAPFSALLVTEDVWVACGSPERFLKKTGQQVISQPIKGTAPRSSEPLEDIAHLEALRNSKKECSENVMIVDLVRNDLSRIALPNSVSVDELFGAYSFKTVHHLISTISCSVDPNLPFSELIRATFPMGSMTGAPKRNAIRLMEELEDFNREIYSGSIGYINPDGGFDFNVVIRSLNYFPKEKYLQCGVGSAITISAKPEQEFEECLIKINRLVKTVYDD